MANRGSWTAEEDELLVALWHLPIQRIVSELGRSGPSCTSRHLKLRTCLHVPYALRRRAQAQGGKRAVPRIPVGLLRAAGACGMDRDVGPLAGTAPADPARSPRSDTSAGAPC